MVRNGDFDDDAFVLYKGQVHAIEQTDEFKLWLNGLRDRVGRSRITARVRRLANGNVGDAKPVGGGVFELRMFFGPGYRAYFMYKDNIVILLLAGGDKDSQNRDIQKAIELAERARDGTEDDTV